MRRWIERYETLAFFALAYALAWIFLPPCYQSLLHANGKFPLFALIGLPGAYAPSLAAIVLTWIVDGRAAVRPLLKQVLNGRVHLRWYLLVLGIPLGLRLVSILLSAAFGYTLGPTTFANLPLDFVAALVLALPFGPLGEELGWRGYALPRLQKRFSPWASSLILGAGWTFWHIPAFQFPGAAIPSAFPVSPATIAMFYLSITGLTLLMTGIANRTGGSVFIAVLFHMMYDANGNIFSGIFPHIHAVPQQELIYLLNAILMAIVGFTLLTGGASAHRSPAASLATTPGA